MSATLNIKVGRTGVEKVTAVTDSIADINESSELLRASSLYVRTMHEGIWEYFADEDRPPLSEPEVLIPTIEDGLDDVPRRIKVLVGNGPRDPFTDPPQWFIDSLKKAFPEDSNWEASVDYPGGEGEAAVMIFQSEVSPCGRMNDHWLDHWGFAENTQGVDLLVSEPYGLSLEQVIKLAPFFEKVGWTFNIVGKSAHYPSATLRIEIQPK
jgi:hypothetical protein